MVCIFHFTNYSNSQGFLLKDDSIIRTIGKYGHLGVYVFFVITGFVIPLSMTKYNFNWKKTPRFLLRRWTRIEIPYLISILLILGVSVGFSCYNQNDFNISLIRIIHHIFYTAGIAEVEWYNSIYWTLAIEMQFYLLIALLYPLMMVNNYLPIIISLLLTFSALILNSQAFVFYYGPIFAQGILLKFLLTQQINKPLGVSTLIICISSCTIINGVDIAIVTSITCFIIAFVHINHTFFNWLGKISYSLYLTHGIIGMNFIYFSSKYFTSNTEKMMLIIAALITSLVFAAIYWKLIENPSQRLSKQIGLEKK